ncbi:MAG: hypothetical protein H6631_05985 [Anaerolineaceae bacterium]|nr:hypothetical protein [Anaerolineaceae bacterium]
MTGRLDAAWPVDEPGPWATPKGREFKAALAASKASTDAGSWTPGPICRPSKGGWATSKQGTSLHQKAAIYVTRGGLDAALACMMRPGLLEQLATSKKGSLAAKHHLGGSWTQPWPCMMSLALLERLGDLKTRRPRCIESSHLRDAGRVGRSPGPV